MKVKTAMLLVLFYIFLCSSVYGATFVVGSNSNLADQNPGDGICKTALAAPHDCTFKAAIQEANVHAGNDTITFNAQLVFSTNFLVLPEITGSGTTIDGSSQWDTSLDAPGVEITVAGGDDGLKISGTSNVVKGIFFTGSGVGIHVLGTGNRIGGPGTHERNVFFTASNIGSSGVFLDYSSRSTTVQYNYFGHRHGETFGANDLYLGNIGIRVFGSDVGAGTVIEENIIGEQGKAGIFLEGCGAVKVRNNLIGVYAASSNNLIPNRIGIEFHGADAEVTDNTISDNTIGQIMSGPGLASGAPYISNNFIGSYLTVHGNSNPLVRGGIHLGAVSDPPKKTVITNNSIRNTAHNGISIGGLLNGTTEVEISNNVVFNNKKNGIAVSEVGSDSIITGNTVTGNSENGIVLNHVKQVVVRNNKVGLSYVADEGNGFSGIRIENGTTDSLIGGLSPTDANYIGYNHKSGIYITDAGTNDNVVIGNIIGSSLLSSNGYFKARNGHHGIAIYDNAESNDIGVSGDSFLLMNPNLILDSGWRGIAVINSNHNRIFSNLVGTDGLSRDWGNIYSGIQVVGTNNIIKYNTISNNGYGPTPQQAGVVIQEASSFNNQVSENSIYSNGADGIDLVNGANSSINPPTIQISKKTLTGTTYPSSTVEFFSGKEEGEGRHFEGSVKADVTGKFTWTKKGNFRARVVTATTTLPINVSTSEFSSSVQGPIFPWALFLPAIW